MRSSSSNRRRSLAIHECEIGRKDDRGPLVEVADEVEQQFNPPVCRTPTIRAGSAPLSELWIMLGDFALLVCLGTSYFSVLVFDLTLPRGAKHRRRLCVHHRPGLMVFVGQSAPT